MKKSLVNSHWSIIVNEYINIEFKVLNNATGRIKGLSIVNENWK
jgi:hypothetical protein